MCWTPTPTELGHTSGRCTVKTSRGFVGSSISGSRVAPPLAGATVTTIGATRSNTRPRRVDSRRGWSPGAGYKIGAVPKHGNQSVFPHQHDTVKMRSVGFAPASQNIHSSHSFFNFQNTLNTVLLDFGKYF